MSRNGKAVRKIWYTRCPVPTASSLAHDLGILDEEFADEGIEVAALNDAADPDLRRAHYDHGLDGLIREGGNVPALWARSAGRETRLLALTWIDEYQAVLTRPDSDIGEPEDLEGRYLGVPRHGYLPVDFWAAMSVRGYEAALSLAGLALTDARLVDVRVPYGRAEGAGTPWGIEALLDGRIDAIYAKGAPAVELACGYGLREVAEFGSHPNPLYRVNNGTPRTVTVDAWLLEVRPDLVTRYLTSLLRAAGMAANEPAAVSRVVTSETGAEGFGVGRAYGEDVGERMRPELRPDWILALEAQKAFLTTRGFLPADFDLGGWVAHEPLKQAEKVVAASARPFSVPQIDQRR